MKVGILGGGQLAQMLIDAGKYKNEFLIYTDHPAESTKDSAPQFIADYNDRESLKKFSEQVDVVTYETETIPYRSIEYLRTIATVHPPLASIEKTQDRWKEKRAIQRLRIPTNDFFRIDDNEQLLEFSEKLGFPFLIKSRFGGYDGKNQWRVHSLEQLKELIKTEDFTKCIAEAFVDFDYEVSVVAVRGDLGELLFYDICKNVHKDGILRYTTNLPNLGPNSDLVRQAHMYVESIGYYFVHVGTFAVEFFVKNGLLYANEIAPRVHNSGHWTMEGAKTSQFKNHMLAVTHIPLESTESIGASLMINFIGDMRLKDRLEKIEGAHFHDYNKQPRPGRKLGHCTIVKETQAEIDALVEELTAEGLL